MIELRTLRRDDDAPVDEAWVLVEKRQGSYFISGRQNGAAVNASIETAAYASPAAAMQAATTWADLLSVPFIYIRDDA